MATALLAGEKLRELILPGAQDDKAGALAALLLQLKLELPFDRVVTIGTVLVPILLVTLVFTKNFAGEAGRAAVRRGRRCLALGAPAFPLRGRRPLLPAAPTRPGSVAAPHPAMAGVTRAVSLLLRLPVLQPQTLRRVGLSYTAGFRCKWDVGSGL